MKKLILFIFLLFLFNLSEAKIRTVQLNKELKYASFIDSVEILHYDGTTHDSIDVRVLKTGEILRIYFWYGGWYEKEYTTNYDPEVGEKVILVLDSVGRLSLFATKIKNYYRFWSPLQTGSIASFVMTPPLEKTKEADCRVLGYDNNIICCFDACLYPSDSLILKNNLNESGRYYRKLNEIDSVKYLSENINNYLYSYSKLSPYGDYFTLFHPKFLGISKKEFEEIKREDVEFTHNKDSIETNFLIIYYQDKIFQNLALLLKQKQLKKNKISELFNDELTVISSPDNKLFNFSLDEKTGGTYRSRISIMYYSVTDSIYGTDFFAPDGYGIIDTLNTHSGTKYVLQGNVRGCTMCFSHHISLVQFRNNEFHWDFTYEFSSRDWNDEIVLDSTKRKISVNYHLNDLSPTCSCTEEFQEGGLEYNVNNEIGCRCVFKFNGITFKLVEKTEKVIVNKK